MIGIKGEIWVKPGVVFSEGILLIEDGRIAAVGDTREVAVPEGTDLFDYTGMGKVLPGFIDPHTHLGLCEEIYGTENLNEETGLLTPDIEAVSGIRFYDQGFLDAALEGGVTTVGVFPGSTNLVAGRGCVVKTAGSDRIVKRQEGLKISLGVNPINCYKGKGIVYTPMGLAQTLYEAFASSTGKSIKEALQGRVKVRVHAHRAEDIQLALRLKKDFDLQMCIEHATEGHLMLDEIVSSGVEVVAGPFFVGRPKIEMANRDPYLVKKLKERGVRVGIMTDYPANPPDMLRVSLLECIRRGVDAEEVLKMVTVTAAEILGIEDRVGTLEVGKDGDVVIHSQSPFIYHNEIKDVFIKGEKVQWTNIY